MYRIGWIINPFRKYKQYCTECLRLVKTHAYGWICTYVCVCVCVCIHEREAETDGPVLPSLKSMGVLPSISEDGSLDLGRKGLLLAQCLFYLHLETRNTYSCWKRKWAGLSGNFPWREHAAICLVPPSCWNGLGHVSGCEAGKYNTMSPAFLCPGENTGTLFHIKPLFVMLVLWTFERHRFLKYFLISFEGRAGRSLLSIAA